MQSSCIAQLIAAKVQPGQAPIDVQSIGEACRTLLAEVVAAQLQRPQDVITAESIGDPRRTSVANPIVAKVKGLQRGISGKRICQPSSTGVPDPVAVKPQGPKGQTRPQGIGEVLCTPVRDVVAAQQQLLYATALQAAREEMGAILSHAIVAEIEQPEALIDGQSEGQKAHALVANLVAVTPQLRQGRVLHQGPSKMTHSSVPDVVEAQV
mmetsp:Transcript_26201/g.57631  ORF Transcript_26201/g.57631 Transcript_26201/m.57631 type:complete len:210 (-) Transcript_26201:411-1040(-)